MCGTSLNVGEAFDTHDATTQIPMSDVGGAKKADSNYLKLMRMDTPQKTTTILETRPIFRDTLLYHVFFTRLKQDRQTNGSYYILFRQKSCKFIYVVFFWKLFHTNLCKASIKVQKMFSWGRCVYFDCNRSNIFSLKRTWRL